MLRILVLCCSLLAPGPALAACALAAERTATVTGLVDGETLQLGDGGQVRLINYLSPRRPLWLEAKRVWRAADEARQVLSGLVTGREVELSFAKDRTDRHGRLLAQVFVRDGETRSWVQGELISRGHGRAYSLKAGTPCIDALLSREAEARAAGLSIWRDDFYRVRPAVPAGDLRKLKNTFAIVEGMVLKVARVGQRTFVNFEADWRKDFTVIVSSRAARLFATNGMDPHMLEGTRIRVRGWIRSFNGPMIEATHPEQVERLNE